jgi:hypothetical protein
MDYIVTFCSKFLKMAISCYFDIEIRCEYSTDASLSSPIVGLASLLWRNANFPPKPGPGRILNIPSPWAKRCIKS